MADVRNRSDFAPYTRGSAVPAAHPVPKKNPRPSTRPKVIRKTRAQLQAESRRSSAQAIRFLAVAAVFFVIISFQIYSHVKVEQLDREIAAVNSEISVVQSENTRLKMQLDANVSLAQVDDYATNVLGMVKVKDYQVNYVNLQEQDSVTVGGGKTHHNAFHKAQMEKAP